LGEPKALFFGARASSLGQERFFLEQKSFFREARDLLRGTRVLLFWAGREFLPAESFFPPPKKALAVIKSFLGKGKKLFSSDRELLAGRKVALQGGEEALPR